MAEKMIADMTEAGTEINKDTLKDYFVNNMDDILAEGGDDLGDINPDDFGDIDPDDFLNGMA